MGYIRNTLFRRRHEKPILIDFQESSAKHIQLFLVKKGRTKAFCLWIIILSSAAHVWISVCEQESQTEASSQSDEHSAIVFL